MISVKPSQAIELIQDCLFNPTKTVVPFLKGAPGTAKSAVYRYVANHAVLKFVDIRLASTDPVILSGYPDLSGKKATNRPLDTFPIKGDSLPLLEEFEFLQTEYTSLINSVANADDTDSVDCIFTKAELTEKLKLFQDAHCYKGWLILFDELPDAPKSVQNAATKILLDRMVGQFELHEYAYVAAAGNRVEDKAGAGRIGTQIASRMIHFTMGVDLEEWILWAISAGFKDRITSFVSWKPQYIMDFNPNSSNDTFSCQRTLEFLHNVTNHMDTVSSSKLALIAGCVSEPVARDFIDFCEFYHKLPSFNALMDNPENASIPSEPGIRYALVGMLASNATLQNIDKILIIVDLLSSDFRTVFIRQAYARNPLLLGKPEFMSRVRDVRHIATY